MSASVVRQPGPVGERCGLPDLLPVGIEDVPNDRAFNKEAPAASGYSHAPIGIEISADARLLEHPFPLSTIDRLSGQPRRSLDQLLPGHFPQFEGHPVAVIQHGIRLHAVGHHDHRRLEQGMSLQFRISGSFE